MLWWRAVILIVGPVVHLSKLYPGRNPPPVPATPVTSKTAATEETVVAEKPGHAPSKCIEVVRKGGGKPATPSA